MALLIVKNLAVKMGEQQILRGVNLTVEDKTIVTVLGRNGVGKTTLLRAISGIYRCSAGSVRLLDREIANLPSHVIVKMGLSQAPEGRQIFSNMTVQENLKLGAYYRAQSEIGRDMDLVLSLFPVLADRLKQNAGSLSGGEQQMLCIGRALMARPKLMLLDEPSLGLAPLMVKSIFGLIERIRMEGTALLLVEQNAKAALRIADYAYIMDGGRIVLEGSPGHLTAGEQLAAAYLGGKP